MWTALVFVLTELCVCLLTILVFVLFGLVLFFCVSFTPSCMEPQDITLSSGNTEITRSQVLS